MQLAHGHFACASGGPAHKSLVVCHEKGRQLCLTVFMGSLGQLLPIGRLSTLESLFSVVGFSQHPGSQKSCEAAAEKDEKVD